MITITGNRGSVKVGYQQAAALVNWSLTPPDRKSLRGAKLESILTGKITLLDVFWSTHHCFSIGLFMGRNRSGCNIWWVWDEVNTEIAQGSMTATLEGNPTIKTTF